NLGLTLAESKQLLKNIQQTLVEEQINQYQKTQSRCKKCDCAPRTGSRQSPIKTERNEFSNLSHLIRDIKTQQPQAISL
ncbi:MAG: hypothetical protein D6756_09620, partial [Cyanobacteria bacterium J083]